MKADTEVALLSFMLPMTCAAPFMEIAIGAPCNLGMTPSIAAVYHLVGVGLNVAMLVRAARRHGRGVE